MLIVITCTQCHKAGIFDVELHFKPNQNRCRSCGHDAARPWIYRFCILACYAKWMQDNNVLENGFPCLDCSIFGLGPSTGYTGGIESNGACHTCGGAKVAKGRLI